MSKETRSPLLKYCASTESFITILPCMPLDIAVEIPGDPTHEAYMETVVRCCVPEFDQLLNTHGMALMKCGDPLALSHLTEEIYELCIEINPDLSIESVQLPLNHFQPQPNSTAERIPELQADRLKTIENTLKSQILGQEEAIDIVCRSLRQITAGLSDPERPLACYLFAGSTGVGKTELTKLIAQALFENTDALLRIDGSEFSLPHEVAKLTGAPPGYVGHSDGGQMTSFAQHHQRGVLLIDEIEKADIKLHHLLLQILDDGHLTDNQGQRVSFKNFLIILTTNTGTQELEAERNGPGFHRTQNISLDRFVQHKVAQEAIKEKFPPEFLNRLDQVIIFNELDKNTCGKIVDLFTDKLRQRCEKLGFCFSIAPNLREHLVEKCFDPQYGAREIRRQIIQTLEHPLGDLILQEDLKGKSIYADIENNTVVFNPRSQAA